VLSDLSVAIDESNLIYADSELKIWQQLNFNIYSSPQRQQQDDDNGAARNIIQQVAIVDKSGARGINNAEIRKPRKVYRIGIVEGVPWSYKVRESVTKRVILDENNMPIWEGYCIDFIKALATKMNFSYELVLPTSGTFGKKISDSTFDGAVGDLIKGDTDMIVAALKLTAEREEYIDFVAPYFEQTGISIVMKKPVPDRSLFKFMTVLKLEVWLSICGAIMVTALSIWLLEIFSPYSAKNWKYEEDSRYAFITLLMTKGKPN
jgi:glutamate receptor, ionotropic, invertebrate